MASYPPPPYTPPPGWDRRAQRDAARQQARLYREQARQARWAARSARRSSIVGPLLLIAVGVVFLLVQWRKVDRHALSEWYGHWWPALFLVAGLIVLAEWAWDQARQRETGAPQYRRSLGGGTFVMLFLLGVAGFFSHEFWNHINGDGFYRSFHLNPDDLEQFLGEKHESDQALDLAHVAGGSLEISNPRGDVSVSGTSDDGRIHVEAHKQVYTRSDAEAERRAAALNPTSSTSGSIMRLTVPSVEGGRADLTVTVPPTAAVSVTTDHGEIRIAGVKAAVNVTANHGDVDLSGLTGPATAHLNSSGSSVSAHSLAQGLSIEGHAQDVTLSDIVGPVSITGEFFGTTHLEHIAGTLHFRTSRTELQLGRLDGDVEISPHMNLSAEQAVGPFILTTSNRNISLNRIQGATSVTNRNGSIELTGAPPLGTVTLADRNGSVRVTLPEAAQFSVQATTTDGEISTDFPLPSQGEGSRRQLQGTVGAGGPLVHITTTNGDISLSKGAVEPLPPLPPLPKLSIEPPTPSVAPKHPRHALAPPRAPDQGGSTTF